MHFDKIKFSLRLKEILDTTDWSCRKLGEKLNLTGATINRYSNGVMVPKITTVKIMADILDVNFSWLCGLDTEKYPNKNDESHIHTNDFLKETLIKETTPINYSNHELFKINEQLSDNQKKLLLTIAQQILNNGHIEFNENEIQEKIKSAIEKSGLSYRQIAEKLGLSSTSVYRYVHKDVSKIPLSVIEKIAEITNTNILFYLF